MTTDPRFDLDVQKRDLLDLSSPDAITAFFARLRYDTARRTAQQPANLGISDAVARPVRRIELMAEKDVFQIYLVELTSVTIATTRGLARAFRNLAGEFLLVLTSDYERIDFVFVDRLSVRIDTQSATRTLNAPALNPGGRPRILTLERRAPSTVALRVIRRFTWTEPDAFAQADKLRSAYAVAEWSEEEGLFNNRALFSDHYLKSRLRDEPDWRDEAAVSAARQLRDLLLARNSTSLSDESELRTSFLEPALKILGFDPRRKRTSATDFESPDYELFATRHDETPLAYCLTYPWMRYLDGKDSARDTETPDENPGAVVVSLLQNHEVPWIIVTNGKLWRLYSKRTHSKSTSYFEVDLEEVIADAARSDADPFRYFWLLFRRQAFQLVTLTREGREEQLPYLDRLLIESADYAKELGDRLKERIFDRIFPYLAEGFLSLWEDQPTEDDLQRAYRATLTLLYRLLFLLYAEARDLLPVREVRGYYETSLGKLKKEVAEAAGPLEDEIDTSLKRSLRADSTVLYERLSKLFSVIDAGSSDLNVPFYNGGLFATTPARDDESDEAEAARFLREHAVPDRHLAAALDLLSREDDDRTGRIFVDYKSLGVRHLGSIYEGLLEFRLRVATERLGIVREKNRDVYKRWRELDERKKGPLERDGRFVKKGQLYLENDKHERKATGSYYTPDYIVKYIVEHAVGPVVTEKLEALRPQLREAAQWHKKQMELAKAKGEALSKYEYGPAVESRWRQLIDAVFDIKVLDPAMGSGHFLVEAVDFITDHVIDFLNAFPWNPVIAHLRYTRDQILESMQKQNVTIDPQKLTDVNLLKRHVLKRCIFGVDINPMAVELAKVSLWLDCFTLGAPLSFLDHHLRCGNSLVGVTKEEAEAKRREGTQMTFQFPANKFASLETAVAGMIAVGGMPDITPDQVKSSRSEYKRASLNSEWAKRLLDVYTSQWFGNEPTRTRRGEVNPVLEFLGDEVSKGWAEHPGRTRLSPEYRQVVDVATSASREQRFFHWQLEFPEVFLASAVKGFDSVVGNPPYDVVSSEELGRDVSQFLSFVEQHPAFSDAMGGKKNLYKLFVVRAHQLAKTHGSLGYIVPMAILGDEQAVGPRKLLLRAGLRVVEAFPQKDDPNRRVFPEAKLSTAVFVASAQCAVDHHFTVRTHPGRTIDDSPKIRLLPADILAFDSDNAAIPSCEQRDWDLAVSIVSKTGIVRLKDIAKSYQGEVNETNERPRGVFVQANGLPALRGANVSLYAIREASQGEELRVDERKFLRGKSSESKAHHYLQRRVGFQRSAPQNNFRRLIAAPIEPRHFCLDTVSYVTSESSKIDLRLLLAVLNSQILDWFFRLTSTNSKINEYQFDLLPLPTFTPATAAVDNIEEMRRATDRVTAGLISAECSALLIGAVDAIIRIEDSRAIGRRSDRAHLDPKSQHYQDAIDEMLFVAYGLTAAESAYVRRRRSEML